MRAATLDGSTPFGITFGGTHLEPSDTSSSSDLCAAPSFSLTGEISEDEPSVLDPAANLQTENSLTDNKQVDVGPLRAWP